MYPYYSGTITELAKSLDFILSDDWSWLQKTANKRYVYRNSDLWNNAAPIRFVEEPVNWQHIFKITRVLSRKLT
jgi:hypothetical protein